MEKKINALGKPCPMPVIMAKKEIEKGEKELAVQVDNRAAVENLKKLAASCGYLSKVKEEEETFVVSLWEDCEECREILEQTENREKDEKTVSAENSGSRNYVVFIGKEWIGDGDHELGKNLMRMFFYTLTESKELPKAVLFMNGGVKLAVGDEQMISHLEILQKKGVEVLVCGTCLSFFGLLEQLKTGKVSNMYDITEKLQAAGKVITL